jgi:membrane fusion protein (multidrug efflux system)
MKIYRRLRRPLLGVVLPGIMAIVLLVLGGCEKKQEVKVVPPPAEVTAIEVVPRTVPVETSFVAQVESSHQVEIVARVNGFLDKILYREGEVVKQGQTMFLMDQKPFLAQVAAARAELDNRKAQLWTAQANLDRVRPLAEQDAASKSDLDNAIGAVQSAEAGVHQAQARLDQAELDLGYTVIKSPVTGVSGEALVREGTYMPVGPGGHLSYVAQIDPAWVNFSISQNQMSQRQQEITAGQLIPPVDQNYDIELELSDGSIYPHTGKLNFVSSVFSKETGTFLVRAELANPDGVLRPGMFVKAGVKGAMRPETLVVPQKAVQQTSNGHVVFVVSSSGTAEVRPVIVGEWVGSDWVISKGLNPGEQVITDGFQRLAPGAPVKVTAGQPSSEAAPAPASAN